MTVGPRKAGVSLRAVTTVNLGLPGFAPPSVESVGEEVGRRIVTITYSAPDNSPLRVSTVHRIGLVDREYVSHSVRRIRWLARW